jgi:putative acetyltransferase
MIVIRPEKPEDIVAVRAVNEAAFGRPAEVGLVDALRRNGRAVVSLVAEVEGEITGHILFSQVTLESQGGSLTGIGLAPMAVIPAMQNRGIGSMLVRAGLDGCREAGYGFAVVLGHPEYYPRFGFAPASRFNLRCEYDAPDEVFMAMELIDGALRNQAGVVKYQKEFDEV